MYIYRVLVNMESKNTGLIA